MTITEQETPLFDDNGRRIPQGLSASVCDPDGSKLNQPALEYHDYVNRITRLHECFSVNIGITAEEFEIETERLLDLIKDNPKIANITNGVYLPVVLPQLTTDDIGETLEQYLGVVAKSYVKTFCSRHFYYYFRTTLAGKVSLVDESRHDKFVAKTRQGPVVGIYFPNPLQGYSLNASREQMLTLPENFILSGIDIPIAIAMYPDILVCDGFTPGLNLAALSWNSTYSLGFINDSLRLIFRVLEEHAFAYAYFSGGLLFIG